MAWGTLIIITHNEANTSLLNEKAPNGNERNEKVQNPSAYAFKNNETRVFNRVFRIISIFLEKGEWASPDPDFL